MTTFYVFSQGYEGLDVELVDAPDACEAAKASKCDGFVYVAEWQYVGMWEVRRSADFAATLTHDVALDAKRKPTEPGRPA